jgi:hypothetical protein
VQTNKKKLFCWVKLKSEPGLGFKKLYFDMSDQGIWLYNEWVNVNEMTYNVYVRLDLEEKMLVIVTYQDVKRDGYAQGNFDSKHQPEVRTRS